MVTLQSALTIEFQCLLPYPQFVLQQCEPKEKRALSFKLSILLKLHYKYQYTQVESTLVTEQLHNNSLFFIKRPRVIAAIVTKMFQTI